MNAEDVMVEEHLDDDEYQYNYADGRLHQMETHLQTLETQSSKYDGQFQFKLQQAISLLKLHTQSYQRFVITRRRRSQQRLRKRQSAMRDCFMQTLMDMQVQFLELLPLHLGASEFMGKVKAASQQNMKKPNATEDESTVKKVGFFEDIVTQFTEEQWLDTFHMTKKAFSLICIRLKPILVTMSMSLESLLAMCIYAMATGSSFRSVGMLFNKPQTYVRSAIYKFVQAFLRVFETNFLNMPSSNKKLAKVCNSFSKASQLPPCVVGVLSIFELPTFAYTRPGLKAYGMDRVIVQVLIDDRLLFRKVEVATQRPTMLLKAPNEITNIPPKLFDGSMLTHFILTPSYYPLRSWLMQKYDKPVEQHEHDFNQAVSRLNIFRDVALQRLFGRWQILSSSEFIEPESKSLIAKACCILHNLLEECDELYSEEWSDNIDLSKYDYNVKSSPPMVFNKSSIAREKRNTIAGLIQTIRSRAADRK